MLGNYVVQPCARERQIGGGGLLWFRSTYKQREGLLELGDLLLGKGISLRGTVSRPLPR